MEFEYLPDSNVVYLRTTEQMDRFIKGHGRCIIMMSMKDCRYCDEALPHFKAAAGAYSEKLWLAYLKIEEVGIAAKQLPIFQSFFHTNPRPNASEVGYSQGHLNALFETLWLTRFVIKKGVESTTQIAEGEQLADGEDIPE